MKVIQVALQPAVAVDPVDAKPFMPRALARKYANPAITEYTKLEKSQIALALQQAHVSKLLPMVGVEELQRVWPELCLNTNHVIAYTTWRRFRSKLGGWIDVE